MKLGNKFLLGGFLLAGALLVIDSHAPQTASAQQQQQKKGGGGGKGAPSFKTDKFMAVFKDSVTTAAKSTVRIKCDGKDTALGVVLTPDGFILTKASDLTGKITVLLRSGEEMDAKWVGHHEPHDLAVLKITASNLIPIEFAKDSKVAPVGNFVASPGMSDMPVTVGVVSVLARNMPPAKGGGKAPDAKDPKDAKKGAAAPNPIGVITADDPRGAKVKEIPKGFGGGGKKGGGGGGGGGKKGGGGGGGGGGAPAPERFKVDDIIIAVNTRVVNNSESLNKILATFKAGQEITVRLLRGDEFVELKMPLPKIAGKQDQNKMGSELSNRRTGFPIIIQHDSVVKPSDCGGPLVDLDGHVIGINIARWGRVESYTVPSETIIPLLPDLMSGKLPPQPKKTDDEKKKVDDKK